MNPENLIQIIQRDGEEIFCKKNEVLYLFFKKLVENHKPIFETSDKYYKYELYDVNDFYILKHSSKRYHDHNNYTFYVLPKKYIVEEDVKGKVFKTVDKIIEECEMKLKNIDEVLKTELPEYYGRKRVVYYKCPKCGEVGWDSPQGFKRYNKCIHCLVRYVRISREEYIKLQKEKIIRELERRIVFWKFVKKLLNIIFDEVYINVYGFGEEDITLIAQVPEISVDSFYCRIWLGSNSITILIEFSERFSDKVVSLVRRIEYVAWESMEVRRIVKEIDITVSGSKKVEKELEEQGYRKSSYGTYEKTIPSTLTY